MLFMCNRNGLFVCLFGFLLLLLFYHKFSFTTMFLQYLSQFIILFSNLEKKIKVHLIVNTNVTTSQRSIFNNHQCSYTNTS